LARSDRAPIKHGHNMALEREADALLRAAGDKVGNGDKLRLRKSSALIGDRETNQIKAKTGPKPKQKPVFNLKSVAEVLVEAGLNPAEEILRVMPTLDPDLQARMHAELLQYVQPKLKSIEVTGKNGGPLEQMTTINVQFAGRTVP